MRPAPHPERTIEEAYAELCCYTLTRGDAAFIHQHVVDAFAVQTAGPQSKPIGIAFGLAGLYLRVERRFSGRQVQQAHMRMARRKRVWPAFALPADRGEITCREVLAAPEGAERDQAIDDWCRSVWQACRGCHRTVENLLGDYGIE